MVATLLGTRPRMHVETQFVSRGLPAVVAQVCPRCGSAEVRRLSVIHQTGLNARGDDGEPRHGALWKHAAPPVRKRAGMWTLLLVTSLVMEVATFATGGAGALAVAGVAIAAAVFSVRAASYNADAYPRLLELWQRSFLCDRCGEVFSAP